MTKRQEQNDKRNLEKYGSSSLAVVGMMKALEDEGFDVRLIKEYQTLFTLRLSKYDIVMNERFAKTDMKYKNIARTILKSFDMARECKQAQKGI